MKEIKFLEHRIIRLWQIEKIPHKISSEAHKKKVICATKKIVDFTKAHKLPVSLVLNQFAFHYVYLGKEATFNKIYIKVGNFLDGYEAPKNPISDDDIELAYIIENDWNTMHQSTTNDFPFSMKSVMMKSGIKIRSNTFFEHSSNFQDFCTIASFVRNNRKTFPQIHSMKEFFLHLPILRKKPGRYKIWQYTEPTANLDKYYTKIYGKIPK